MRGSASGADHRTRRSSRRAAIAAREADRERSGDAADRADDGAEHAGRRAGRGGDGLLEQAAVARAARRTDEHVAAVAQRRRDHVAAAGATAQSATANLVVGIVAAVDDEVAVARDVVGVVGVQRV